MLFCSWCEIPMEPSRNRFQRKTCSDECLLSLQQKRWSPLRRAYEMGWHDRFKEEVKARSYPLPSGCWLWWKIKNDYPVLRLAGKNLSLHRVMLESKTGLPLGSQHAHHVCGNSWCVNPEHLVPATHRENIGEMFARASYLSRISELEEALRAIDPGHPTLRVVPVK